MDPFNISNATFYSSMPMSNFIFLPGIIGASDEDKEYLNSLDDDTREYILNHSSDFQSRDEVIEFVNRLHEDDRLR